MIRTKPYIYLIIALYTALNSLNTFGRTFAKDSINIVSLNDSARQLFIEGKDGGWQLLDSALNIAEANNDKALIALCYKNKGVGDYFLENYASANAYYDTAIFYYLQSKDLLGLANCYNNIAIIHHLNGELDSAMSLHLKALEIREVINDENALAISYRGISNVYGEMGQHIKAIDFNNQALAVYNRNNDSIKIASLFINMASDYNSLQKVDSAIFYIKKALSVYSQTDYYNQKGICYINLAGYFSSKNEFDSSLYYFTKGIEVGEESNNIRLTVGALAGIAMQYQKESQFNKSIAIYLNALRIVKQTDYLLLKRNIFKELNLVYSEVGNYEKAYLYLTKYHNLKDSIVGQENAKYISELETKYETEKKQRKIESLTKDNEIKTQRMKAQRRLTFLLIAIFTLSGILVYLYLLVTKNKQRNIRNELTIKNLQTEQRVLRSQMNPHFIYNSLNSIQSFISSEESYQAEKYLARFAKLMRGILENSRQEFVVLDKEIEVLQVYLELEQLRFEKRFDFKIEIDDDLESDFIQIPPMLIQPFLENAILHGFKGLTDGQLILSLSEKDNKLFCEIDDNGMGRKAASTTKADTKKQSLATKITEERLLALSEQMGSTASFEIIDKTNEQGKPIGTRVTLVIPINEEAISK